MCEYLSVEPVSRMAATLDRPDDNRNLLKELPLGWHWLYFLESPPTSLVGDDGRTVPGGFLPDTGLPRRMWAGGSIEFTGKVALEQEATCTTTIRSIVPKSGRTGKLVFVSTEHRLFQGNPSPVVIETRDLVFREAPRAGEKPRLVEPPTDATWRREVSPDPVMLFRFSALTFNAHRIHYDVDYCRNVEGYPDLVVHGPMIALLLLDLVERMAPDQMIQRFRYRNVSPLFAHHPFAICGTPRENNRVTLWAENHAGGVATEGEVELVS